MLDFNEFYSIAEYGNTNWKGSFTPREIANCAYDYLLEFEESKANEEPTHTIKELCKLLADDDSDVCRQWLGEIAESLNLIDLDWADHLGTDEWLQDFIKIYE